MDRACSTPTSCAPSSPSSTRARSPGRRSGSTDPVGRLDAHPPARGAARLRPVREAGPGHAAHRGGREPDRFRPPHRPIEAGAVAALSRRGCAAPCGSASRTTTPRPISPRSSAASPASIRWSRWRCLRGLARARPAVAAGALELALVTDHPGLHGFELLREQPLVWAASERFQVDAGAPIPSPSARSPASGGARRTTRSPRPSVRPAACSSPRISRAIGTVVRAGLAATTLPESMVGEGLRILGAREGSARTAADPDGAHSRAGPSERGDEGARQRHPRNRQPAGAPGGVRRAPRDAEAST